MDLLSLLFLLLSFFSLFLGEMTKNRGKREKEKEKKGKTQPYNVNTLVARSRNRALGWRIMLLFPFFLFCSFGLLFFLRFLLSNCSVVAVID